MQVREIAAASAGDQDLLARAIGPFQDRDAPAALARLDRAHQPGGSGAQNYRIKFVDHDREACTAKPRQRTIIAFRLAWPIGLRIAFCNRQSLPNSKRLLYRG